MVLRSPEAAAYSPVIALGGCTYYVFHILHYTLRWKDRVNTRYRSRLFGVVRYRVRQNAEQGGTPFFVLCTAKACCLATTVNWEIGRRRTTVAEVSMERSLMIGHHQIQPLI